MTVRRLTKVILKTEVVGIRMARTEREIMPKIGKPSSNIYREHWNREEC